MSKIATLALIFAFVWGAAGCGYVVCWGDDRKETEEIIATAYLTGVRLAIINPNPVVMQMEMLRVIGDLAARAERLPPACQRIITKWGKHMGQTTPSPSTQCVGGVCCDRTGCVGS